MLSKKEDKFTSGLFVRLSVVPLRLRFWSSVPALFKEERSTVFVPPSSRIMVKSVPVRLKSVICWSSVLSKKAVRFTSGLLSRLNVVPTRLRFCSSVLSR